MEELVELGSGSELGRGLCLARDSHGIYVAEAPKSLRLRPGDRVLGARLSFEGMSPEAVGRLLEGAGGCRVSLQLRRRSPATPATPTGTPGTPTRTTGITSGTTPGTTGSTEGQRDGVARLTTPIPTPSKKPPAAPTAPLSVELSLPKLPKPRSSPTPPEPPRPRITVREAAAAARTPLPEPPEPPEPPRAPREFIPAMEVAAPKGSLGLSPPQIRPGKGGSAATPEAGEDEEGASGARGGFPTLHIPSVTIDVPKTAVEFGVPSPEPPKFAVGLRKLSRELEAPLVEIAPKPPKFRLPRLGWALGKLREGGGTPLAPPHGIAIPSVELDLGAVGDAKLKVPKLSLGPLGDTEGAPNFSMGDSRVAPSSPRLPFGMGRAALPKFGGSSPDLRPGEVPKTPPKRGGSAESLILGWTALEPPKTLLARQKSRGASPRISIPAVGLVLPGQTPEGPLGGPREGLRGSPEPPPLKVPVLELAPPGLDGTSELPTRRFGVKLPKFGAVSSSSSSSSGSGSGRRMRMGSSKEEGGTPRDGNPRRRRWVPRVGFTPGGSSPEPPKLGRMRFPDVELCPGDPQIPGGIRTEGIPKFQLPQLVLSPQICGEP